jgi:hypothetical protein
MVLLTSLLVPMENGRECCPVPFDFYRKCTRIRLVGHEAHNFFITLYILTNMGLQNTTLEYGFHFQHRNLRTLPTESFAHDSGRTLVRAEYGYLKGSPITNS